MLHSSEKSPSVTYLLDRAAQSLDAISDVIPESAELSEKLKNYRYEIEDIAERVEDFISGDYEGDPTARLNKIEGRLDAIAKLKRKYGSDIGEILAFRNETAEKLDMIEQSDEKISEIKEEIASVKKELEALASELRTRRRESAEKLCDRVSEVLEFLDMPKVRFDISILPSDFGRIHCCNQCRRAS